jgi:hypothetical protein
MTMVATITNLDLLLTRKPLAEALRLEGYPVSAATLATRATRGGGPPFCKFGARALYRWGDALAWARSKLSPVVNSTSELDLGAVHETAVHRAPEDALSSVKTKPRHRVGEEAIAPT